MSHWFFDRERWQREDIESLKEIAESIRQSADSGQRELSERVNGLERDVLRLTLLNAALLRLLEARGIYDPKNLRSLLKEVSPEDLDKYEPPAPSTIPVQCRACDALNPPMSLVCLSCGEKLSLKTRP